MARSSSIFAACVIAFLMACAAGCQDTNLPKSEKQTASNGADATGRTDSPAENTTEALVSDNAAGEASELGQIQGLERDRKSQLLDDELKRVDPREDNAEMEAVTEEVLVVLKAIGHRLEEQADLSPADIGDWLSSDARATSIRPTDLQTAFEDADFKVARWSAELTETPAYRDGMVEAAKSLANWSASLHRVGPAHIHFKVVRATVEGESASTSLLVQSEAFGDQERIQQTANWECQWSRAPNAPPRLSEIHCTFFEEVVFSSGDLPFADITASVLGENECYQAHFLHGGDHWRSALDWRLGLDANQNGGLSLGDVNGDGLDDVYVCQPGGLPNRLLLRQTDGTVRDISAISGTDVLEPTSSSVIADFDNDGDQDLVVASGRYLLVLENNGEARFQRRDIVVLGSFIRGLAAADYDLDGDVDLYCCGYFSRFQNPGPSGLGFPIPYHDATNGGENYLMRNDGGLKFSDVTKEAGLDVGNNRFSYAAGWEDYDQDGDPDIYVANDFGKGNLYRNDDGKFVDVAAELGVEDISAGMSVSWGDYDRDGLVDLYKGNMFSTAGNRVTYNRNYGEGLDANTLAAIRRHARGNSLFRQRPDGKFEDTSVQMGVTMGRWAWCSSFADLNNDGWEDILVLNGMVTGPDDTGDL